MEDIKSSFDRMMDKLNESVTHSAPKKLSFDYLNDPLLNDGNFPKKRRISYGCEDTPSGSISINASNSSLNTSTVPLPPPSPWETRRMRADLIEANARISTLKHEIERCHKERAEMEVKYESKVDELKKQCSFSSDKILDLEKHMQVLRKREQAAKYDKLKMQKELNQQKHAFEEKLHKIERAKLEAEESAALELNSLTNELSEYRRHAEKLEMELDLVTEELGNMKAELDDYKARAAAYTDLRSQWEQQQHTLSEAHSRIENLEYEIASYADWKEITKNSQSRLCSIPDLEKEVERLKVNNKNLLDLLGNKLLLEEQVHDLKTRLEKAESAKTDAVALQVKLAHVEQQLKDWIKVAQDHCLPNMLVSPMALRARIEQILQKDIIMASEKSSNVSETKSTESELLEWKQKCEIYAKNIEELNVALKRHKVFKERVQKKLLLVSKERDCYKQLLENFEKDLTISNTTNAMDRGSSETQLRYRLEMLEKTLAGYRDMCANLEKELTNAKQLPNADSSLESAINSESYEHFKKELDVLRLENERLRRRKDELELELEHRCLKGDFNLGKYKVVHLIKNPAAEAYENAENLIEKLQAEITRLKRRIQKMEEDNEATQTATAIEHDQMTINIKEINQLRAELESSNNKIKKLKEYYKSATMEFREVCYMLFGYKIDRIGTNTNYKLSSMYAESPDDYLNFRLNESNVLDMLETPYSVTLKPLIESQLIGNKSLPAFLSSLTLELFQRATITIS